MRRLFPAVVLLLLYFSLQTAHAGTWYIQPDGTGDAPTIQAGLDSAAAGDTVLVAAGEYFESLFWPFRNGIILIGAEMENTHIIGNQAEAVLYMVGTPPLNWESCKKRQGGLRDHDEKSVKWLSVVPIDSSTVIRRIHFKDGGDAGIVFFGASPILDSCLVDSTRNGRGIHCLNGSGARIRACDVRDNLGGIEISGCDSLLSITSSTIIRNSTAGSGGGIHCRNSSGTISDNNIALNSAQWGGGIRCDTSSCVIFNNSITGNSTQIGGGGIYFIGSSGSISENTISDNTALSGGGIYLDYYCTPDVSGNIVEGNTTSHTGGGFVLTYSTSVVSDNTISGNTSSSDGGGIFCSYSSDTILVNTIFNNSAGGGGGGICLDRSGGTVSGNTIRENSTSNTGGGILCTVNSNPTITNNTVTENYTSFGGGGISCLGSSSPLISANLVADNRDWGVWCDASAPTISNNTIIGNGRPSYDGGGGIGCGYSSSPNILNNAITKNRGNGIFCGGSSSPTISGNMIAENSTLQDPGGGIICLNSSSPTITGNTISRNSVPGNGGGLYCTANSNPTFSLNTVTENTAGDFGDAIYSDESVPDISNCNIAYNGVGIYNASYSSIPAAQNNWWGDPSGPWHAGGNPSGQGDSLSTYAWDFDPWLTEADTTAPPIPPVGLIAILLPSVGDTCFLEISWLPVPISDLAGYRLYFDTDTTGFPYSDTMDVGNVTEDTIGNLECGFTYYVAVACYDNEGNESWYSAEESVYVVSTGIPEAGQPVPTTRLLPNHPNPFNPTTTIRFDIPQRGEVRLAIYDVTGRLVATLVNGPEEAGRLSYQWDARESTGEDAASGIYFARLEAGEYVATRKMVLLR